MRTTAFKNSDVQQRSEASPKRMADTHLELVSCLRSSEQHSEPRHLHHVSLCNRHPILQRCKRRGASRYVWQYIFAMTYSAQRHLLPPTGIQPNACPSKSILPLILIIARKDTYCPLAREGNYPWRQHAPSACSCRSWRRLLRCSSRCRRAGHPRCLAGLERHA